MTNIQPILGLFARFREATSGNTLAASFLTLAHLMQEDPSQESIPPPPKRMLSTKQAAEYLGCTPSALWAIVARTRGSRAGHYTKLPTIRFFQSASWGPIGFERKWLDEFMQRHRIKPQSKDTSSSPCRPKQGIQLTNDDIQSTLDLFALFREATDGDILAASFLTLTHAMQEGQEASAKEPAKEPTAPPTERMLNLKEAAEYLGFTPGRLYEIVARSRRSHAGQVTQGPTVRFFQDKKKGSIRFKREWLDEFVRAHQISPRDNRPMSSHAYRPVILRHGCK